MPKSSASSSGGGASGITTGTTTSNGTANVVLKTGATGKVNNSTITDNGTTVSTPSFLNLSNAGAVATPQLCFGTVTSGFWQESAGVMSLVFSGVRRMSWDNSNTLLGLDALHTIGWSNTSGDAGAGTDAGLQRVAASILKVSAGVAGSGWLLSSGKSRVAADVTNNTTTMANVTGLSSTLIAGRHYSGRLVLFAADSTAADGLKVDFDGGTATATDFRAHGTVFDTALLLSTQTTAIATDFATATMTGNAMVEIYFEITCNAAGTFIPRFAQNAHTAGTATIFRGSYMLMDDTA